MISLTQALLKERDWSGSMIALAEKASSLCETYAVRPGWHLPETTKALVMSYRTLQILTPPRGKRFVWDHLVLLIAARVLVSAGWSRERVAEQIHKYPLDHLAKHMAELDVALNEELPRTTTRLSPANHEKTVLAARMLAAGVCSQYRRARSGVPTIHDATLSTPLAQSLLLLSSLYVSAGQEDSGGSVHEVLQRCRQPLGRGDWNLPAFADPAFQYHGITLLDTDRRIPTLDCVEMARQTHSELDLREQFAFEALRSASEQFIGRQEDAYTDLRLWVTGHPITFVHELRAFERAKNLQLAASFLASCYEAVQPYHLVDGKLYVCESCGTPMRRAGGDRHFLACRVPQCQSYDRPLETLPRPFNSDTLVAKGAILTYWIGPGLDELTLHKVAESNDHQVRMYPAKDACDLSIDGKDMGVDVKSYASPFILADRLNRSTQGLAIYRRQIVAINDQAIARFSGYLDVLRRQYTGDSPLEFMSVRELMKTLEQPF